MPPQEQDLYNKQAEEYAYKVAAFGWHKNHPSNEALAATILSTIPLASLLRDKARLDWLDETKNFAKVFLLMREMDKPCQLTKWREAIDTAMKENKPV